MVKERKCVSNPFIPLRQHFVLRSWKANIRHPTQGNEASFLIHRDNKAIGSLFRTVCAHKLIYRGFELGFSGSWCKKNETEKSMEVHHCGCGNQSMGTTDITLYINLGIAHKDILESPVSRHGYTITPRHVEWIFNTDGCRMPPFPRASDSVRTIVKGKERGRNHESTLIGDKPCVKRLARWFVRA